MNSYLLKHHSILHSGASIELCILSSDLTIEELFQQYKKAGKDVLDPYLFISYIKEYLGVTIILSSAKKFDTAKTKDKVSTIQFEDIHRL